MKNILVVMVFLAVQALACDIWSDRKPWTLEDMSKRLEKIEDTKYNSIIILPMQSFEQGKGAANGRFYVYNAEFVARFIDLFKVKYVHENGLPEDSVCYSVMMFPENKSNKDVVVYAIHISKNGVLLDYEGHLFKIDARLSEFLKKDHKK